MGSTLGVRGKDGSPAADNLFWAPSGGAVWKLLTRRGSILDHELPEGIGDAHPDDGVEPVALMPDVHAIPGIWTPLKGYDVLVAHLRSLGYREPTADRPGNLVLAPYDWRLSNRWYVEKCGGHEVTRKLVTLGTPWRGATNANTTIRLGGGRATPSETFGEETAYGDGTVRARVPDLVVAGESLDVDIDTEVDSDAGTLDVGPLDVGPLGAGTPSSLDVTVHSETGTLLGREVVDLADDGSGRASFRDLPPGTHTVTISGPGPATGVRPVTSSTMVWPSEVSA